MQDLQTVIRVGVFLLRIIFVFGFLNDCWCAPRWQWQIGALAIFLAYINFILLLKGTPVLGVPISMLFNIVITFLKLIYLPVLLILSFAIPFYMVFVRDSAAVPVSKTYMHICTRAKNNRVTFQYRMLKLVHKPHVRFSNVNSSLYSVKLILRNLWLLNTMLVKQSNMCTN